MSTIGSLSVNVVANTEKFSKGMRQARNEMSLLDKASVQLSGQMKMLFTGVAASLAAGFTISAIKETISQLDDLTDAAERLGTTAARFGGLQHAAFMSDVSSESLAKSLTILEKNVANNSKAFKSLGLSVGGLKHLDAVEMFVQVADAINRLPTAVDKTAASMAVFGKQGAQMLELISKGREGIAAAMEEARRMGLAPTDEEIKRIEKADAALKKFAESYRGLKHRAATAVAPVATDVMDMTSAAMGSDTPAQRAWDSTINTMRDDNFARFTQDLKSAEQLPWFARPFLDDKIYQHYLGEDFGGYDSFYVDESIRRRQERERMAASAPPKQTYSTWRAAESTVESLGEMLSGFTTPASAAWSSLTSGPAFAFRANPDAFMRTVFGNDAFKNGRAPDDLDPALVHRISSAVNELVASSETKPVRPINRGEQVPGNAALEFGTAAAFSQEKRSQQASAAMENAKQQLKAQQRMDKSLQNIDKNLAKVKQLEVVNIA